MSEDRTQPPSKRRRQLAREQGQVAHSPELTAAVGWMVALVILGFWGNDLTQGLIALLRGPLLGAPVVWVDSSGLLAHVRGQVTAVAVPLGVIIAGFAMGALAAHQLQVQGLWATALIAPDPARLSILGREGGLAAGFERMAWAVFKALVLVSVSLWALRAEWAEVQRLGELDVPMLASATGHGVLQPARVLGMVMLFLGLADYGLRYLRFEAMLRTTPHEQREDQRVMEGDLSLRARRRRLARAWRGDAPELLAGASLILGGSNGLTLVLTGGPPPRRVTIRTVARGKTGLQIRHSNTAARVPQIDAPDLARRLEQQATAGLSSSVVLPAHLMAELASVWSPN
jgi:flagellar biosynthesis protein FlhB